MACLSVDIKEKNYMQTLSNVETCSVEQCLPRLTLHATVRWGCRKKWLPQNSTLFYVGGGGNQFYLGIKLFPPPINRNCIFWVKPAEKSSHDSNTENTAWRRLTYHSSTICSFIRQCCAFWNTSTLPLVVCRTPPCHVAEWNLRFLSLFELINIHVYSPAVARNQTFYKHVAIALTPLITFFDINKTIVLNRFTSLSFIFMLT